MAQTRTRGSARTDERFSTVSPSNIPRSSFDRSYSHKTTMDSGDLVPVFIDEVLPGDTINIRPSFFARMATPLKPFMDGIHLDYQFFFCPLRLVWDNFIRMMGERPEPADHNDYTIPQMISDDTGPTEAVELSDYFGLPANLSTSYTHSSLFHRCYNLIYNEWYRDENLQDRVVVDKDDGPDAWADYSILKRGKRKDYFSGSLPWAQKGDPVSIGLGDTAVVQPNTANNPTFKTDFPSAGAEPLHSSGTGTGFRPVDYEVQSGESQALHILSWGDPSLEVDLSAATAVSINSLRQALGIQHLLERDARGGSRYRELMLSHFGVHSDDIRLLRPEILGTGSTTVNVMPVPVTADLSSKVGDLAAFATAASVGRGFMKNFTEHGIVMGIASIRADLSYQQGLDRMFSRKTRFDFYWPDLAHLGEQTVLSREIYTDGTGDETAQTGDFEVFGYQPRYEEYRHRQSIISGQFRSNSPAPLDIWHTALDFDTRPVLNAAFIEENPPIARLIAVTSQPEFILDCFFKVTHVRPMPKYGTPGMTRF